MNLSHLRLTQNGFRLNKHDMQSMIEFVKDGGKFDRDALAKFDPQRTTLIAITQFPDGQMFVRDGLHRTIAVFLGRKEIFFHNEEFVVENMTYEMYTNPCIANGWYTPFDPRTEVRKASFFDFKDQVKRIIQNGINAEKFIRDNKSRYAILRNGNHFIEFLAKQMEMTLLQRGSNG